MEGDASIGSYPIYVNSDHVLQPHGSLIHCGESQNCVKKTSPRGHLTHIESITISHYILFELLAS